MFSAALIISLTSSRCVFTASNNHPVHTNYTNYCLRLICSPQPQTSSRVQPVSGPRSDVSVGFEVSVHAAGKERRNSETKKPFYFGSSSSTDNLIICCCLD